MHFQGLILYFEPLQGSFFPICASTKASYSPYTTEGAFCLSYASTKAFCLSYTYLGVSILICVLFFRGVISFESIGLPRFRHNLYSFANCPLRTSIRTRVFEVGICDFVTFFVSIKAYGN